MVMILNQCLPPDFNDLDWLEKVMLLQWNFVPFANVQDAKDGLMAGGY
jgi:hypothetical protein